MAEEQVALVDETGRAMHGSWGNMIDAEDAFARMGADVMRWQYCAQPPDRNLLFGFGPAQEIKRRLLNHWDNLDGSVERGYAGRSLWRAANLAAAAVPGAWLARTARALERAA